EWGICSGRLGGARWVEKQRWLQQHPLQLLAATPSASQLYTEVDLRLPSAVILGAEHTGISPMWPSATPICIPMAGQIDSLNVAQAASIILFEAMRQRRQRCST